MSENNILRTLPHSKESEMMVLGSMLTSINGLNVAAEALDDADFYFTEHKTIFQVLKSAYNQDRPADVHLVYEELKRLDKLKTAGGAGYITTLAQYVGTSAYIEEYVDILKQMRMRRDIIQAAQETIDNSISLVDPSKIILDSREKFNHIGKHQKLSHKFPIRFLNEFENNFLLTDPPKKPMLLEYLDLKCTLTKINSGNT
jgi:replicative DNA helicase